MMTEFSLLPTWDIPTINVFVEQQENYRRGPLVNMEIRNDWTVAVFDDLAADKPETNTIVTMGRAPAGATIVFNSVIYVSGLLTEITAYISG